MATIWEKFSDKQYVGLQPWTWVQLESAEPPGPFPYVGGVAPEVVAGLHEAHQLLASAIETVISDVFACRTSVGDPAIRLRVEDAYAELVNSRPHLKAHITCGRGPHGRFQWDYPKDPAKSATMSYAGVRIFNAVARQAIPLPFERPMSAQVGKFIGLLDGTRTASELKTVSLTLGREVSRFLTGFMEALHRHQCLVVSATASVRQAWLDGTRDQDVIHLGHAGLLYRQREQFLAFDPWLMPWFAEAPVPSIWTSLLPRPAAVFLTHDHDDHVDPRTLLHLPKDLPIVVPSRRNRRDLYFDYLSLLRELGFSQVVELAHGETWRFEGGAVVSVPFFGEDPCDLEMPRNCYLIADRGHNVLVHVDSGPTNGGKSAVRDGVIDRLVKEHGPVSVLYASQQQLKEIRTYAAHAPLSPPGQWLDPGENGFLTNDYLRELAARAEARLFVSYATGGADWFPDHLSFMFSQRNPARTALLTAHWEPPGALADLLAAQRCGYHPSRVFDIVRCEGGAAPRVASLDASVRPLELYRRDGGDPPFLRNSP
jgi:L-ascorbate metabolism protein UlaG (beta-lactamase superfamily)